MRFSVIPFVGGMLAIVCFVAMVYYQLEGFVSDFSSLRVDLDLPFYILCTAWALSLFTGTGYQRRKRQVEEEEEEENHRRNAPPQRKGNVEMDDY